MNSSRLVIVITAVATAASSLAQAQPYHFTKVTDSLGPHQALSVPAMNAGGVVAYRGELNDGSPNKRYGIYTYNEGVASTIVEAPFSGSLALHQFLGAPAISDNNKIVFRTTGGSGDGLFESSSGQINLIADYTETGISQVIFASSVSSNGSIAYWASFYPHGDRLVINDSFTFAEGSLPVSFFGVPSINSSNRVAFWASLSEALSEGIYMGDGSTVVTLSDWLGPLHSFGDSPTINDSGTVAFTAAYDDGGYGIFTSSGGAPDVYVDSTGEFNTFGNPTINANGEIAYLAWLDSNVRGLFVGTDPVAGKVIAVGETLFGSPVVEIDFSRAFNANGSLAFWYKLESGVSGIAIASAIPEPSTSGLIAAVVVIGGAMRPRMACRI